MFAFVLAHVARKPFNVDVVLVGKMFFQLSTGFAFDIALVTMLCLKARCRFKNVTLFAFKLINVARKPFNVDIVDLGKMPFQIATEFAFELAYFASKSFNVNMVLLARS